MDSTDNWTKKIWTDTNALLSEHGNGLDIVYSDPEFQASISSNYAKVVNWTSGATSEDFPALDLNNSLGYDTIQKAVSSWATLSGDTLYVKSGTYNENIFVNKAISLTGENKETTIIDGGNKGSVLRISGSNVKVTGFTVRNGNSPIPTQSSGLNSTAALMQLLQSYGYDISQLSGLPQSTISTLLSQITQATGSNAITTNAGIYLSNTNNCTIIGNIVKNSTCGILLSSSSNNTLKNNDLTDNKYGFGVSATTPEQYINEIDNSNTINGKPIYYWTNKNNMKIPSDAGYVAIVNCTEITISNLQLSDNYNGLLIVNTEKSTIANNTIENNCEGLRIINSENNILQNNNMDNTHNNFYADLSHPNKIDASNKINGKAIYIWTDQHDKIVPSDAGYVALINCSGITVQDLNLTNNEVGVLLQNVQNSSIAKNTLSNMNCAIELTLASNNLISQNFITGCQSGIKIEGTSTSNRIISNTISNVQISGISILSSDSNILQDNQLTDTGQGVIITDSSHNSVESNGITASNNGIQLQSTQSYNTQQPQSTCTDNKIVGNNVLRNQIGVSTSTFASGNAFYHNNFVNNTQQTDTQSYYSSNVSNIWDNGKEGNYWSNYNGTDINHDGIGDQPYIVSQQYQYYGYPTHPGATYSDVDKFPLMKPFSPS